MPVLSSSLPFVGRDDELNQFEKMLAHPDGPRLMWVVGPAGQGKSRLIEAFMRQCQQYELHIQHSQLFDFFDDALRTRIGAMIELAKRFDAEQNPAYKEAIEAYQKEAGKGDFVDKVVLRHLEREVQAKLVSALCANIIGAKVIFADTIELIAKSQVGIWFFDEFVPKLFPHFCVVAAGREIPSLTFINWQDKMPIQVNLGDFKSSQDVYDYFTQYFGQPEQLNDIMSQGDFEHIYQLTKSSHDQKQGQPLLVALACEAIAKGHLSLSELHSIKSIQTLQQQLVDQIFDQITELESVIILELAHIYYGISPEGFKLRYASKYEQGELATNSFDEFVQGRLLSLPYIKYHSTTKVIRLHDYFRDHLNQIDWLDIIGADTLPYRQNISEQLLHQLGHTAARLETSKEANSQLDTVQLQRFYHLLFVDRERAYGQLWERFDKAWHAYKLDYMDQLLAMVRQVNDILMPVNQFDPILDRMEKSARAWMYLETSQTEEALALAQEVIDDSAGVQRLYLTCLVAKGTALGRLGKIDEGVVALQNALTGYETLFKLAKEADDWRPYAVAGLAREHGISTIDGIQPERYLILNTIGYLERQRSRFDEANEAFKKSFELSSAEGDKRWRASAATQLGTVARYRGKMAEAYDFIESGLWLRRQLKQQGQIAFGLQALGMLQRDNNLLTEARQTFEEVLDIWLQLGSRRDQADTFRNLGWVDYLEKRFDAAEKRYKEAEVIYKQLNIPSGMPSLRHKQGVLWIAKAESSVGDVDRTACLAQAEAYLQDGVTLGGEYKEPIYEALCLTDLCDVAEKRRDYERMHKLASQIRRFEKDGYRFAPVYAHLKQILGNATYYQAMIEESKPDLDLFDEAISHYCQMYVYLIGHNPNLYRYKRAFLREWMPSLPKDLRQRAAQKLIACWQAQPDSLAQRHPGLIRTVELMRDL